MAALQKVTIAWAVLGGLLSGCDDNSPCRSECGDGVIACLEECDDRNLLDGDGCSASCRLEGCADEDGDGHPAETCGGDDCDDLDPGIHPGAPESLADGGCDNGLDDDCDGFTDNLDLGCWPCFSDAECDDLDVCNGVESCASGACRAGEPLDCDDGLFCNGAEACDAALGCQPGAPPCPAPDECVRCQEELDTCFAADGTPCDDHDGCTTTAACQAGACAPGPRDLDADGDGFVEAECGGDDCDDQAAAVNPAATEWLLDASCHDGIDNDCDRAIDGADIGCWDCLDDAECDDGLFCNGQELCGEHLGCLAGTPPCPGTACNRCQEDERTCLDPEGTACGDATVTACDGADTCDGLGACLSRLAADGQPCEDETVCNGAESCRAGACQPGEPLVCDDGLFCNGAESCDPALGCQPGALPCPDPADCNRCQEEIDSCLDPEGTPCGDTSVDPCNGADTCDGQGSCDPRHVAAGTPCDDGEPCTSHDTCLEGACSAGPVDLDADGDGFVAVSCGGDDCEDGAAWVNPMAIEGDFPEECADGVDDDCDGFLDRLDQGCFNPQLRWQIALDDWPRAISISEGKVYLGGYFKTVGSMTGVFDVIDLNTLQPLPGIPEIESYVSKVAGDGSGGWYIAGGGTVNDEPWVRWLHLRGDGTVDGAWNPPIEIPWCVTATAGTVFVGGGFTEVEGNTRYRYLVALDPVTGALQPWQAGLDGLVKSIHLFDGKLYLLGSFTHILGESREHIAALDAQTKELLPFECSTGVGSLADIAASGSALYLAGDFSSVGGQLRSNLAAVDSSSGDLLPWSPVASSPVLAISAVGTKVYIGGYMDEVNGQPRKYIAALDATTGELLPWSPPAAGGVTAIRATDQAVFVNGSFLQDDGNIRAHLCALDPDTGDLLEGFTQTTADISEFSVQGNKIAMGGNNSRFGAATRNAMAAFPLATGELLDWQPSSERNVLTLEVFAGKVYAGSQTLNEDKPCFRAIDGTTGQDLFGHPALSSACQVTGMDRLGSLLYLGAMDVSASKYALDLVSGSWLPWSTLVPSNIIIGITVDEGPVYLNTLAFDAGGYDASLSALDPQTGDYLDWRQATEYCFLVAEAVGSDVVAIKTSGPLFCHPGPDPPRDCGLVRYSGATGEELWRNYDFIDGEAMELVAPDLLIVQASVWIQDGDSPDFTRVNRLIGVDANTGQMAEWSLAQQGAMVLEAGEGYLMVGRQRSMEAYELP